MNDSMCETCGQAVTRLGRDGQPSRWCSRRCYDVAKARLRRQKHGSHHPEREPTYRGVIALDGEGINGAYTLLAASNGEYIQRYSEAGLGTAECFDFLLGLDPKPLKWGFAFTYDVNMILRDLSFHDLKRLQTTSRVFWYNYSIHHFPGKMFRVVNRLTHKSVTVWDLYPFIQSSFVKFLRKFDLASPEEIQRIADMKDQRSDFSDVDPVLIRRYCMSECKYLERGVTLFLELFEEMGYRTNAYYSPGTLAALEFRNRRPHDFYKEPPEHVQKFVDLAYYGGRAEISQVGPDWGGFWQYDINSAYPYAATLLPCLQHGRWERSKELHAHGVYHIKWDAGSDCVWGPFPWRPQTGSLKYPNSGTTYVWGIEILPWVGKIDFEIMDGFVWRQACEHKPFRYLSDLYDDRRLLKDIGDNREYVVKLILNSTYGKLAQRRSGFDTDGIPKWQALAWAGLITATTRAMLGHYLRVHDKHVLMVATDSILTNIPLHVPVTDRLGEWSEKKLENLFIVGAGFLFAENGAEKLIRTRGLRSTDVNYRRLMDEWQMNGKEGTYPIQMTRFFGYGISLQRKEGYKLWRRFHTIELQKRFSQFPRRRWVSDNIWDGRTQAPTIVDAHGSDLLDGVRALDKSFATSSNDEELARLLLSLASARQMDDNKACQPEWVLAEMGD